MRATGVALLLASAGCHVVLALAPPAPDSHTPDSRLTDTHAADTSDTDAEAADALISPNAPQPVTQLNTSGSEDDPTLTGDMLEIYFERARDIFRATRLDANASWSTPAPVKELNSSAEDGTPGISTDGLTLYLSSRRGGQAATDVYVSHRTGRADPWETPQLVPTLNSGASDNCAAPTAGHLALVMDSDRLGGPGKRDLFLAVRTLVSSPWGPPVLIPGVNSASDDECPWLDKEHKVMFFASGRPDDGDRDIWFATRASALVLFGTPMPVPRINSPTSSESDPWLSPDRKTIYFVSDRAGSSDIFVATVD